MSGLGPSVTEVPLEETTTEGGPLTALSAAGTRDASLKDDWVEHISMFHTGLGLWDERLMLAWLFDSNHTGKGI